MNNISTVPYLSQKAEPWVSKIVLVGCILITIGLVYASREAYGVAASWSVPQTEFNIGE
jgi:hypothetical protein